MRFAIYSRKSVLTGRGESIENQVELCRSYLAALPSRRAAEEVAVYEDEGFRKDFSAPSSAGCWRTSAGRGRRPWCATGWTG